MKSETFEKKDFISNQLTLRDTTGFGRGEVWQGEVNHQFSA